MVEGEAEQGERERERAVSLVCMHPSLEGEQRAVKSTGSHTDGSLAIRVVILVVMQAVIREVIRVVIQAVIQAVIHAQVVIQAGGS